MSIRKQEIKDRLNIYLPMRLKRRLKAIAEDKDMTMNDLVVTAISNYIDHADAEHSAPDLVLDRINQVLNSQILLTRGIDELTRTIKNSDEE